MRYPSLLISLSVVCLFLIMLIPGTTAAPPSAPVANFTATPLSGSAPLPVSFTDLSLNDPTGWAWFFGDENFTAPWTRVNTSAGWSARYGHSSVAMPDGSIVLMGGYDGGFKNDTWRSTDKGATWTPVNANAGWSSRSGHTSVAMPDGSIVLMGGSAFSDYYNDVWRSTNNGATWTLVNASAGWTARYMHSSVAMPDGSIVLMGGYDVYGIVGRKNDTWQSANNGATWTQVNASAGWRVRSGPTSVAMPDGSIVLMGGIGEDWYNDVWRSTDNGATWTQLPNAGWTARYASSVAMPDGSIVLMGGYSGSYKNDTWRFQPAGSSLQNPSHTYTTPGSYTVALQAYNEGGYNSTRKTGYITVTELLAPVANFSGAPRSGTAPLTVHFTDNSTNTPISWNWSFGDESLVNATVQNPVHTYASAGTFTVSLNATNDAGSDTRTNDSYINVINATVKIGVVRNNKTWILDASGNGAYGAGDIVYNYGTVGDRYVTGDWNGNGTTKVGVVRNNNTWLLDASGNGAWGAGDLAYTFGKAGDVYVTGDWTGTGTTRIGVVRSNTTWLLDASGDGKWGPGDYQYTFGKTGDVYVTGDWNDDRKTEIGVVRNNKTWILDASGNGVYGAGDIVYNYGIAGDKYVTGDWNGNGTTRIGVVRSNTTWLLDASGNGLWSPGDYQYTFGKAGDRYVTGKWN